MTEQTSSGPVKLSFGRLRALPMLYQTESSECGNACIAMISTFHGLDMSVSSMRSRFPLSTRGSTLLKLIDISSALGMSSRPLRLELDELKQLKVPCILYWDLNHFVVLKKVGRTGIVIHDPSIGVRTLGWADVSTSFTGIAIELSPGPDFTPKKGVGGFSLRGLTKGVTGLKATFGKVLVLALVLEMLAIIAPLFVQVVMDRVLTAGDTSLLTLVGIGFTVLMVMQALIAALRSWIVTCTSASLSLAWTSNVFSHLMKLPEDYFSKRHLGDVVSRFGSIEAIQRTLTTRSVEVILDGLMAIITLAVMLAYSPWLALITLLSFVLYAALRAGLFHYLREGSLAQLVSASRQQTQFFECIRGALAIRLFNQGPRQAARYMNRTADTLNRGIVVQRVQLLFGTVNGILMGAQRIALLWVGATMALAGNMTVGMLMAFLAYSEQFSTRGSALIDYVVDLRMLRLQVERLADIVTAEPERHVMTPYHGEDPSPGIELRGVSFRYGADDPWVLQDCNISIHPGETVAVVGPSGCGKSTLAKILLGLLEPTAGKVLIGGIELARLGKARYRDMLGVVMQDDQLFAGSVAENICFFDHGASMSEIEDAARAAALHEDVLSLPMGYQSLIGDMGSTLSGGQRQRLLLARAIYRKPRILVLDEATSHLDIDRERVVNESVKKMKITRVIIAHRPETIAIADRVIDLSATYETVFAS